jgi:hypothetical protein
VVLNVVVLITLFLRLSAISDDLHSMGSMKQSTGVLFLALAASGALSACSGRTAGSLPATPSSSSCGTVSNDARLLYPKPGARDVTVDLPGVYIAAQGALMPSQDSYSLLAVQSSAPMVYPAGLIIANVSVPEPHASYPPGYRTYEIPFQGGFATSQTVKLYWDSRGSSTRCTPTSVLGTFSTK